MYNTDNGSIKDEGVATIIADSILDAVPVTAGPAALGLVEIANVILQLQAMLEENGSLSSAPQEIKQMVKVCITPAKALADALSAKIGTLESKPIIEEPIKDLQIKPKQDQEES